MAQCSLAPFLCCQSWVSMEELLPSSHLPNSMRNSTANTVCLFTLPTEGVRLQEVAAVSW